MVPSSNSSDGIQNNVERYFWASYFLFGLLSSLIGDTLILIASFQRDAFKINKLLVTIIQHIAISDLGNALNFLLPTTISLLANAWILGDGWCYFALYALYFLYPAGMSLIAVLTTSKCLILRYPLRVASWTRKRVHVVCSLIWAFSVLNSLIHLAVDKADIHFQYRIYNCEYRYKKVVWKYLNPVVFLIYGVVPNIIILVTTAPTLKYLAYAGKSARQVQGSIPRQGALTVALTAAVYSISTLPFPIYQVVMNFIKEDPTKSVHATIHRVIYFVLMINIISNFYIYTLTIKSFRRFLLSKVVSVVPDSLQYRGSQCSTLQQVGITLTYKVKLISQHRHFYLITHMHLHSCTYNFSASHFKEYV